MTALLAAVVAFSIGSSWTTAGTLGIGGYAPYYFFAFFSPLALFVMAATGFQLVTGPEETTSAAD